MWKNIPTIVTVVLFLLQIYVFVMPAYGATCTADCGGGNSVSCTAYSCIATDKIGCRGYDENGKIVVEGNCKPPQQE